MKNILLFISPQKDFLPEHKIATKIQIDNSLRLGWKKEDLIIATNFPYEYRGVKSLLMSDDNFAEYCPTVSIINVIVELFDRKLIKPGEIYWYHDHDAYQLRKITEKELDLENFDMALCYKGLKQKWDTGGIFFKSSAEDIFRWLKEITNNYQVNEEYALMALFENNLLWITASETEARKKSVPLYPKAKNLQNRIKTLNLRYLFGADHDRIFSVAKKPLKVLHFHFTDDRLLDSAMYGKNSLKKMLLTPELKKIFHNHHIIGTSPKTLKNLMIYLNPQEKFPKEIETLIKRQIDNSLNLGWKNKDIIIITNFPWQYQGVETTLIDYPSQDIANLAITSNTILNLLYNNLVKEAELWWFHDFNTFQHRPLKSSEIELLDTVVGFIDQKNSKFDTSSFFFRKGSQKFFEWTRNRSLSLKKDEATALSSLSTTNFRNINTLFTSLKLARI